MPPQPVNALYRAVTDGSNLARRGDVVVVSVNHRLNLFGFLHLQDIGGPAWTHCLAVVDSILLVQPNGATLMLSNFERYALTFGPGWRPYKGPRPPENDFRG
jgi:hypothetical protein